jgi:hypothetical protein
MAAALLAPTMYRWWLKAKKGNEGMKSSDAWIYVLLVVGDLDDQCHNGNSSILFVVRTHMHLFAVRAVIVGW